MMTDEAIVSVNGHKIALYGATGVTGGLVLERLLLAGWRPRLIGRASPRLRDLAALHSLEYRIAGIDEPSALDDALLGCSSVLNLAGPFVDTAMPIAQACARNAINYLDISGELASLRQMLAFDQTAKKANIAVITGAGFGIAATDILALRVVKALGGADALQISVAADSGFASQAVAASTIAVLRGGGYEVSGGRLMQARLARRRWLQRLPDGKLQKFASAPLADLAAALHATGAPRIVAGVLMHPLQAFMTSMLAPMLPVLLSLPAIARRLSNTGGHTKHQQQDAHKSRTWVQGRKKTTSTTMMLEGGEGFALSADIACHAMKTLRSRRPSPGAYTPATGFGADWLDDLDGVDGRHLTDSLTMRTMVAQRLADQHRTPSTCGLDTRDASHHC